MIDTSNIQIAITMADSEFRKFAEQGPSAPLISVVEVEGGWAIYGPHGVYLSASGERIFKDLAALHQLVKDWGFDRFMQDGVVRVFPE